MNPTAILGLISNLYAQIVNLQEQLELVQEEKKALEKQLNQERKDG